MSRIIPSLCIAVLALGWHEGSAQAQSARTYVSAANGNDANDCSRPTPCRSFSGAHDKTLANGEITVLDPGGYGSVTITKSISIVNDGGGEASILVSGGGVGIVINAGAADAVNIRGVTIQGIGFGSGSGIRVNSGKSLTVENCVIRNLTIIGIDFAPTTSSALAVSNTFLADNGQYGVYVQPSGSGAVSVALNRVEVHNSAGRVSPSPATSAPEPSRPA